MNIVNQCFNMLQQCFNHLQSEIVCTELAAVLCDEAFEVVQAVQLGLEDVGCDLKPMSEDQ